MQIDEKDRDFIDVVVTRRFGRKKVLSKDEVIDTVATIIRCMRLTKILEMEGAAMEKGAIGLTHYRTDHHKSIDIPLINEIDVLL